MLFLHILVMLWSKLTRSLRFKDSLNRYIACQVKLREFSICNMGMPLTEVVKKLQEIAPLKLAESWDNVGLLVEPNRNKIINNIILTIDLTEDVVEEAIETKSELIISYHPNIFKPLKQITERYLLNTDSICIIMLYFSVIGRKELF